jgi:hypothetical protein
LNKLNGRAAETSLAAAVEEEDAALDEEAGGWDASFASADANGKKTRASKLMACERAREKPHVNLLFHIQTECERV